MKTLLVSLFNKQTFYLNNLLRYFVRIKWRVAQRWWETFMLFHLCIIRTDQHGKLRHIYNSSVLGSNSSLWRIWHNETYKRSRVTAHFMSRTAGIQFSIIHGGAKHHRIENILVCFSGGSKERRKGRAPPPPLGQIFFIFMQFSGKIRQIVCWRPPSGKS